MRRRIRKTKCAVCGSIIDSNQGRETKRGFYCWGCLSTLPECVQRHPDRLEEYAIKELKDVCLPRDICEYQGETTTLGKLIWFKEPNLVKFSGVYIPFPSISRIEFSTEGYKEEDGRRYAHIIARIELNAPRVYLTDDIGWAITEKGKEPWWRLMRDMGLMRAEGQQGGSRQRDRQQARRQGKATGQEQKAKGKQGTPNGFWMTKEQREYYNALSLFMLSEPYTEEDLHRQHRRLQKAFHPDIDPGNLEFSKRINAAYGVLKKYSKRKGETRFVK